MIVGLVDAEGSFAVSFRRRADHTIGYELGPQFIVSVNVRDRHQLEEMAQVIGTGKIYAMTGDMIRYQVGGFEKGMEYIIPFFEKYPLVTKKQADFVLWAKIVRLMYNGVHKSGREGFINCMNHMINLNYGHKSVSKWMEIFPEIIVTPRPEVKLVSSIDPDWLNGFISGDGSFYCSLNKYGKSDIRYRASVEFSISQHVRDTEQLELICKHFGVGSISFDQDMCYFRVRDLDSHNRICQPYFSNHTPLGAKYADYLKWLTIIEIFNNGKHNTLEGQDQIIAITASMNKYDKHIKPQLSMID